MNKHLLRFLYATIIIVNIAFWGYIRPQYMNADKSTDKISMLTNHTYNSIKEEGLSSLQDNVYIEEEKPYIPEYKYGQRIEPSVDIITANGIKNNIGDIDTTEYKYIGEYKITGYTPGCEHCCGNTEGITASGVEAIVGYTVATEPSIPFGTTLYIEGYGYYVVEDRGAFDSNIIDIAASTHEECYSITNSGVNVYIVPYND